LGTRITIGGRIREEENKKLPYRILLREVAYCALKYIT